MKYLKTFENINTLPPRPGDYVLCTTRTPKIKNDLGDFLNNNIGKVVDWFDHDYHPTHIDDVGSYRRVIVEFENLPEEFRQYNPQIVERLPNDNCRTFALKTIVESSPNKEELEVSIQMRKFNI